MITVADFPDHIKVAVAPCGFGQRVPQQMNAWLDENCGADGRVMTS
jgi:hypothetical protein